MLSDEFWRKMQFDILTRAPRVEMLIARLTLGWGLWLLNPYIDTFNAGRGFDFMRHTLPEGIWGVIVAFVGARLYYGIHTKNIKLARNASFGAWLLWLLIAIMIVVANPIGTGSVIYPLIAYYSLRVYLLLSQQYLLRR